MLQPIYLFFFFTPHQLSSLKKMAYTLRTRGKESGNAATSPEKATAKAVAKKSPSAASTPNKKTAVPAPTASGNGASRSRSRSPGRKAGVSPRANKPKSTVPLRKLKRGLHKELAIVSRQTPSATKQQAQSLKSNASQRQSLNASINKRGVLNQLKSLGANPIHRVAKVNVKHGLNVLRPAVGKRTTVSKAAVASKNLQRAVIKELDRVSKAGSNKPTEINSRVQVAGQRALVNSQIIKTAVIKEINQGKFNLKKSSRPASPKKGTKA